MTQRHCTALSSLSSEREYKIFNLCYEVNPAKVAGAADTDTLIVHGRNDIQTSVLAAQQQADATGGQLVAVDGVNHVLKQAPKNRLEN